MDRLVDVRDTIKSAVVLIHTILRTSFSAKMSLSEKLKFKELCPDQLLWLRMFHKIDLTEWRYEIVKYGKHRQPQEFDFVYVGVHYEDLNRAKNIEQNKYFYWPTPPVQDEHVSATSS